MKIGKFILIGPAVFALVFCTSVALGQTNWAIEGSGPLFGEFNAPPVACGFPPTLFSLFTPPTPTGGCPPLSPFPFTCDLGGTAFDNDGNFLSGGTAFPAMLHTDGRVVEMVDAATGAYINSWIVGGVSLPGVISGLGYDSTADIIWVTNGIDCIGLGLSGSCTAPLPVVVPIFPLPVISGAFASGLDYDPCTGTLWFCDCGGIVVNCTIGGVYLSHFSAAGPIGSMLTGLTVNTATVPVAGSSPNIQVTDGALVAEFTPGGALAAPVTHYLAANPFPIVPLFGLPVGGLGFTLRPIRYGKGCPSPSGSTPSIGYKGGYPYVGNAGFKITMTGATPGTLSYIVANVAPSCTPASLPGCPGSLWIAFPWLLIIPLGPVPAAGYKEVPAPIPASPPCGPNVGVPVYCQFINVLPGPVIVEMTDALAFTIGDA